MELRPLQVFLVNLFLSSKLFFLRHCPQFKTDAQRCTEKSFYMQMFLKVLTGMPKSFQHFPETWVSWLVTTDKLVESTGMFQHSVTVNCSQFPNPRAWAGLALFRDKGGRNHISHELFVGIFPRGHHRISVGEFIFLYSQLLLLDLCKKENV